MKHSDFKIGMEFKADIGRYRCTDVGTRVIVAIKLATDNEPADTIQARDRAGWFRGPPYPLAEQVFDEFDQEACEPCESTRES